MPENDKSQHNPKYCELEHLLEKMAKESENKAFYTSFRQHYDTLLDEAFEETNQNQTPIRIEQKKRTKCWLQPYITLSICLKKGFISCGMDDLNPTEATAKIAEQRNTEILKNFFNFDLTEFQALIDFLR
ncbi:hypothetical protein JP0115_04980 [Helicobacter pylori]|nr:hypothetical protein JP0115_04980 [Helicobacter pylori]